jgi:signal transduction histidine kinase
LNKPSIYGAINGLEGLLADLHEKGKILKSRNRDIHIRRWLKAYVNQKSAQHSNINIHLDVKGKVADNLSVRANYEQLETIFDNLFANSLRAISEAHTQSVIELGWVNITLSQKKNKLIILFKDNGRPYKTVSGRGTPQIKSIMKELGGSFRRYQEPFRIYLTFPINTN